MSISRRIAALFRVKADKALDRAEDPREVLDYSYEQQLEMVQKVRRGLADVATSRKRVELQLTKLQLSLDWVPVTGLLMRLGDNTLRGSNPRSSATT